MSEIEKELAFQLEQMGAFAQVPVISTVTPKLIRALKKCREQRNSWIIAHSDESGIATESDDKELLDILNHG